MVVFVKLSVWRNASQREWRLALSNWLILWIFLHPPPPRGCATQPTGTHMLPPSFSSFYSYNTSHAPSFLTFLLSLAVADVKRFLFIPIYLFLFFFIIKIVFYFTRKSISHLWSESLTKQVSPPSNSILSTIYRVSQPFMCFCRNWSSQPQCPVPSIVLLGLVSLSLVNFQKIAPICDVE